MLSNYYETKFSINKREFIECIYRATLLVKREIEKPIVIVILKTEQWNLKISSYMGSMNEEIDIERRKRYSYRI